METKDEFKTVDVPTLVANRVPPGDNWSLWDDTNNNKAIYSSIIDVLEAYFNKTAFSGKFMLDPKDGKIFAIKQVTEKIKPAPIKTFNIYGDPIYTTNPQ